MTRMIKASRRYRITYSVTAYVVDEIELTADDDGEAEDKFLHMVDVGKFHDTFSNRSKDEYGLEVEIDFLEDIGNAITGE